MGLFGGKPAGMDEMYNQIVLTTQQMYREGKITREEAEQTLARAASDFEKPVAQLQSQTELAEKQADAANELLAQQTEANRPNQVTPWGSSTWSQGEDGQWTQTVNLTPQAQSALDSQMALAQGRSDLANSMLGQAQTAYSSPMDWGSLPQAPDAAGARQQAIDAAYGQAASRLDPRFAEGEEALRTRLYNQGFREGDEGFTRAMQEFGRTKNDAYQGAMNSAIGQGTAAGQSLFSMGQAQRQQGISEALQQRNQPLNEMNALLGGQQVENPQMPGFAQAGLGQAPNYMGAAQNQFAQNQSLFNLGQMQQQQNSPMNLLQYAPYFLM